MDHVYALGVSVIQVIQDWFVGYEGYFEFINDVTNPNHALSIIFPLLSIVDSVFASQLCLCVAFGSWLNSVMKWWLLEDRPYWWVRETDFYGGGARPVVWQTPQTCETGPGCPSGHAESVAMMLVLAACWIEHVVNDRKLSKMLWWKYVWYPVCAVTMASVMLARMFVGTHFPHQVLAGAAIGGFLAPFLCIYVSDPYIWQYGPHSTYTVGRTVFWHSASAIMTILISVVTYYSMTLCGFDPQWTVKLAFRWCEQPEYISVSTTPMYALAHSTGYLLGWALAVTPCVAKYRHYTTSRSLVIAAFATACIVYPLKILKDNCRRDNAFFFYLQMFGLSAVKVPLLLRLVPYLAMWPYEQGGKVKKH